MNSDEHDWDDADYKSKTRIKKEMLALQDMGKEMVELPIRELDKFPLDDELRAQIDLARGITSRSGRKRQLQYIGKLLRNRDVSPIQDAFAELQRGHRELTRQFHELEQLRDQLLEQGDDAIEDVITRFPAADRQQLRQLIRQARKEQANNAAPAAARKIFRYLRELAELQQG